MYKKEYVQTFLEKQGQLFDEPVADDFEEAEAFLEDCMAVVLDSLKDVKKYLDGMGADVEGISLKEFAVLASGAKTLHLAFLLEMGMGGVWSDGGVLANVKNMLVTSMRFLDADLICAPITYPYRIGPWRVTSAQGEVSKRVEIRRARKLEEIQAQRRRERQKALEEQSHWGKVREVGAARVEEKIPQWKQRLRQRLNGETANHEGRRRKRKRD